MGKRIQFVVDDEVYIALEDLRKKTDAKSMVEVFRNALRAYEWMVKQLSEGREIKSTKPSEESEKHFTGIKTGTAN